jgi:hypothetical protein
MVVDSPQHAWFMSFHGVHGSKHCPFAVGVHMLQPLPTGPP